MNVDGHLTLFQPTSKYQNQASEMCWAKVKGHVGKCYNVGRNQDDLIDQATVGFYGGNSKDVDSTPVTARSVQGWAKVRLKNLIKDAVMMKMLTLQLNSTDEILADKTLEQLEDIGCTIFPFLCGTV